MSLTPEILQQRYATIERLYSEREWGQVEALGAALLRELPEEADDPVRLRLQLLLGHTRLYGLGVVDDARRLYRTVLANCSESVLREIAERGLQQCQRAEQEQDPGSGGKLAISPGAVAASRGSGAAMPWMEELAVEVVEEPEQLQVAQADPQRAEHLDLTDVDIQAEGGGTARPARRVDPLAFDPTRLSARELEELTRGLLRVRLH